MRIVQLTHSLGGGGSNAIALAVKSRWPDVEDEHLMAVADGPLQWGEGKADFKLRGTPKPSTIMGDLASMRKLQRHLRPDVVLSHGYGLNHVAMLAKCFGIVRCPIVVVEHGNLGESLRAKQRMRRKFSILVTRFLYRRADCVVAVSAASAHEVSNVTGIARDRVVLIPGGIDICAVRHASLRRPASSLLGEVVDAPRPWVVAVGRLVPEKDFNLLLHAFQLFHDVRGGTCFVLGDGPLRDELLEKKASLGLSTVVHLLGHQENPFWFMREADAYVMTSSTESLPLVLLEAAACGSTIIAPGNLPGVCEALAEYPDTILVAGRSAAAFAAAMNDALAITPSGLSEPVPQRFRIETMIDAYHRVVRESVSGPEKPSGTPKGGNPGPL